LNGIKLASFLCWLSDFSIVSVKFPARTFPSSFPSSVPRTACPVKSISTRRSVRGYGRRVAVKALRRPEEECARVLR
jgi:hypothetical protein